jgi:hypothetical protein
MRVHLENFIGVTVQVVYCEEAQQARDKENILIYQSVTMCGKKHHTLTSKRRQFNQTMVSTQTRY